MLDALLTTVTVLLFATVIELWLLEKLALSEPAVNAHANVPCAPVPLEVKVIDTAFTFGNTFQVLATRPITASFGTIRFSESLGTFQLANAAGDEIITPETVIEQALLKLSFVEHTTPLKSRQNLFNRPFNTIFMPAESESGLKCAQTKSRWWGLATKPPKLQLDEPVTDAVMTPEGLMVICGVEAATVTPVTPPALITRAAASF